MKSAANSELLFKLPSVDTLLRAPSLAALLASDGLAATTDAVRIALSRLREEVGDGRMDEKSLDLALGGLAAAVERQLRQSLSYSLLRLINATGVILHTNLGRAPLGAAALDHVRDAASAYSNLEFDLATGERGKRDVHVDRLFQKLLADAGTDAFGRPAERGSASPASPPVTSTIVVNNNAAAVLLALNSLAEGGEVIVSRGELVEIGGSFRIPDVMSKSNATLREVGTTNRTRIADYENAIGDGTRLLLRVHRSNFEITGFTEQPALNELVALARRRNLPLMEDLGSGALFDLRSVGINGEPGVLDSLRAGVDVVTYSGDKLRRSAIRIDQRPRRSGRAHALEFAVSRVACGQAHLCRARSHAARLCQTRPRCSACAAHDAPVKSRNRGPRESNCFQDCVRSKQAP